MSPVDSQTISVPQSQHSLQPRSEDNPWLSRNDKSSFTTLKKSEVAVSRDSDNVAKAKNKLQKRRRETEDEVAKARDDAVLEINPADLLLATSQGSRRTRARTSDSNSDEDDEVEEQEERLKRKGAGRKYNAFGQKDLVTLAFAGDNAVEVCMFRGCFWCDFDASRPRSSRKPSVVRSRMMLHERSILPCLVG